MQITRALLQPPGRGAVEHFHVVDLMRGLAALMVVVFHYQHFFIASAGEAPPPSLATSEPLHAWLWPIYEHGRDAVQFFWLISGFVFCAVYTRTPATTRAFVVNRFARLYPLHFLTLVIVLALQLTSEAVTGHQQIYANNDAYHFVLQLFFASRWGFEVGHSFNGPIWTVSIEVAIYAVFWATLPFLYRRGILGPALLSLFCWPLAFHAHLSTYRFFECAFYFFAGVSIFLVFLQTRQWPWRILAFGTLVALAGLAVDIALPGHLKDIGRPLMVAGFLILGCGLEALGAGDRARRLQWLGDNTYGTYLWHVPVQLTALIVLDGVIGSRAVVFEPWFLLAYVVTVSLIARGSFLWFERPMRTRIRRRFETAAPREDISAP